MSVESFADAPATVRVCDLPDAVPIPMMCRALGISDSTGYLMIQKTEIPCVKIGTRRRVRRDVIEAMLAGVDPWTVQQDAVERAGGHR